MCVVAGWISSKPSIKEVILSYGKQRGYDSFGYKTEDASMRSRDITSLYTSICEDKPSLYFARAIPEVEVLKGTNLIKDTQPFSNDNWITIHHGTIHNDEDLRDLLGLKNNTSISQIDSALLPYLFDKFGFIEGIRLLAGSYSIIAFNKKEKKFYWATNFMTLYYYPDYKLLTSLDIKEFIREDLPAYSWGELDERGCTQKGKLFKRKKEVLVVCSGGLDSSTAARLYDVFGFKVTLFHAKYGQLAEEAESNAVHKICEQYGYSLIEVNMRDYYKGFNSMLLQEKRPDGKDYDSIKDAESAIAYVPLRNLLLCSVAAMYAEHSGIDRLALGLSLSDNLGYPDNSIRFLQNLSKTLQVSTQPNFPIIVEAPLINLTKSKIVKLGLKIGSPFHLQVSCYFPEKFKTSSEIDWFHSCGNCGPCQMRKTAFSMNETKDPSIYLNMISLIDEIDKDDMDTTKLKDWLISSVPEKKLDTESFGDFGAFRIWLYENNLSQALYKQIEEIYE
jgi:7-cyano-7-deazaguanine synthase